MSLDDHPVSTRGRAGGGRLGRTTLDLDQALTTGGERVEQRVVAESGDRNPQHLGGADNQRALGHLKLNAVDCACDGVGHFSITAIRLTPMIAVRLMPMIAVRLTPMIAI